MISFTIRHHNQAKLCQIQPPVNARDLVAQITQLLSLEQQPIALKHRGIVYPLSLAAVHPQLLADCDVDLVVGASE